jgi:hypothetical protein
MIYERILNVGKKYASICAKVMNDFELALSLKDNV